MNQKNKCIRKIHIRKTSFKLCFALLESLCSEAKLVNQQPNLELVFDTDYGKYTLLCKVIEGNLQNDKSKSAKKSHKKSR